MKTKQAHCSHYRRLISQATAKDRQALVIVDRKISVKKSVQSWNE
jgi:hypothetical protein